MDFPSENQNNQQYQSTYQHRYPDTYVDFRSSVALYLHKRVFERDARDRASLQPAVQYRAEMSIPEAMKDSPASSFTTRLCRTVLYRPRRSPINALVWTPEHRGTLNGAPARYVITGSSRGDFTVWNSHTYEKSTFTTTHDCAIRDMTWTHDQRWLVSCDDSGKVKYYNASLRWQKIFQAHDRSCRALSFAPTDAKFATCSDDKTVRVWDFKTQQEDAKLDGHGWDVKCVCWHPQKSLIASGSKDRIVKLWDPRNGKCIVSLEAHKHTVNQVTWNRNGIWLLTSSRDQQCKLFDIRMISEELDSYFHESEITALAWHPIHEDTFASGDKAGNLYFWRTEQSKTPAEVVKNAHYSPTGGDAPIWCIKWHSLGHQLVTGCNDHTTKFWCRQRPGVTKAMPSSVRFDPTRSLHNAEERIAKLRSEDASRARQLSQNGENLESKKRSRAVIPGLGEAETDGILEAPAAKALDFDYNEALRKSREERQKLSTSQDVGIVRPQAFVCTNCGENGHIAQFCPKSGVQLPAALGGSQVTTEYCGDFQRGCCTRGQNCKYLHQMRPAAPLPSSREMNNNQSTNQVNELCQKFQKGLCHRGSSCKYIHTILPTTIPLQPEQHKTDELCQKFQKGLCTRGDSCKYVHKILPTTIPCKNIDPEVCQRFLKGLCTRGSSCKYLHVSSSSSSSSQELCGDFQRGMCTRGQNCRFRHELRGQNDRHPGGYDDRRNRGGYDDRRNRGGYDDRRNRGGYDDRNRGGYDDRNRGGYNDRNRDFEESRRRSETNISSRGNRFRGDRYENKTRQDNVSYPPPHAMMGQQHAGRGREMIMPPWQQQQGNYGRGGPGLPPPPRPPMMMTMGHHQQQQNQYVGRGPPPPPSPHGMMGRFADGTTQPAHHQRNDSRPRY